MTNTEVVEKLNAELKEVTFLLKLYKHNGRACEKLEGRKSILEASIKALEQQLSENIGELSDGYHTFNQLYHQRAVLFACIVKQNKNKAWKSFKHSDGKYCFDSNGEWFIVGIDTPQGSYTYHYAKEYWDMFDCQELECAKEWDGHTEEDVTRLLSLEQQPSGDCISRIQALAKLGDEPENWTDTEKEIQEVNDYRWFKSILENLPSVTPSRPRGHWILIHPLQKDDDGVYICSNCEHGDWDCDISYKYCPFCGADMRESGANTDDE